MPRAHEPSLSHCLDVFCHPSRDVDVVLAFDASSDVQTGAALSRINDFGSDRGLDIVVRTPLAPLPPHPLDPAGRKDTDGRPLRKSLEPEEIDERFKGRYAQVLDGHWIGSALPSPRSAQQEKPDSDLAFVYCPLLPNSIQPGFDPAVSDVEHC